jgi:hypothetical protein
MSAPITLTAHAHPYAAGQIMDLLKQNRGQHVELRKIQQFAASLEQEIRPSVTAVNMLMDSFVAAGLLDECKDVILQKGVVRRSFRLKQKLPEVMYWHVKTSPPDSYYCFHCFNSLLPPCNTICEVCYIERIDELRTWCEWNPGWQNGNIPGMPNLLPNDPHPGPRP